MAVLNRRNAILMALQGAAAFTPGWPLLAAARPDVPVLNPRGNTAFTEGPTDFTRNLQAIGTVNAHMAFVDFPDVVGEAGGTTAIGAHLTGNGRAQTWFREQSYGNLDFRIKATKGWRRMPKPVTAYIGSSRRFDYGHQRDYVADVVALFPDLDLQADQILLIVTPETDAIALSPAFIAPPYQSIKSRSGNVQFAVTFGKDSFTNTYINLCHEVCHVFGLPDLYNTGSRAFTAGAWDIMCDIFRGTSLLGWHRHKLGWLHSSRIAVLNQGSASFRLTPLSARAGVSMVVVAEDKGSSTSKVYVAEIAQTIIGRDGTKLSGGVLVYSVDAAVPTGRDPIQIIAASKESDRNFGALFQAPFQPGATMSDASVPFTLSVGRKRGQSADIEISLRA